MESPQKEYESKNKNVPMVIEKFLEVARRLRARVRTRPLMQTYE